MHVRTRRSHRVFAMHRVGQSDIDGIDFAAAQALVVLLIAVGAHMVAIAEFAPLFRVARYDGLQLGVARMLKGGQDHGLRNMAGTNHGIANALSEWSACTLALRKFVDDSRHKESTHRIGTG